MIDAGTCNQVFEVSIQAPAVGSWFDGGGGAAVVQVISVVDAGVPARVVLSAFDGTMASSASPNASGTLWTGDWAPPPGLNGDYALEASVYRDDAGAVLLGQATVSVQIDQIPPTISAINLGRDAGLTADPVLAGPAFYRDADPLPFQIIASDNDGGSGLASVVPFGSAVDGGLVGSGGGTSINLQALPLPGLDGTYAIQAIATDAVGNVTVAPAVTFSVTRWKWISDVATTQGVALLMPAVSGQGTAYVTANFGNSSPLSAVAIDGGVVWQTLLSGGHPVVPPVIEPLTQSTIFEADSFSSNSTVNLVAAADGGLLTTLESSAFFTSACSGIAVDSSSNPIGTAFFGGDKVSGGIPKALALGVESDGTSFPTTSPSVPGQSGEIVQMVAIDGGLLYAYTGDGGTTILLGDLAIDSSVESFDAPSQLNQLAEELASPLVGSAQDLFYLTGTGQLTHVTVGSTTSTLTSPFFSNAVEPLVDSSDTAYVVNAGLQIELWSSGLQHLNTITVFADQGMLLGDKEILALSTTNGTVSAVDRATLNPLWVGSLTSNFVPSAEPAITCSTNGESLLLIGTTAGQLVALVVDDKGLDTSAIWPKARRDQLNSANASLPISACP